MFKKFVAVFLAALSLSGCSFVNNIYKGESPVTVNWYCVRDDSNGVQTCQKRSMRDGKPVDDVVLETIVIPAEQTPPPVASKEAEAPAASAGDAVAWSRQPLSTVNAIPAADLEVENIGPAPRQTANAMDLSKRREQAAALDSAVQPGEGYTLQMGAFSNLAACDKFVAAQQSQGLTVSKRNILSRGAAWCIVTHGQFPTERAAVDAARQYLQKYPRLSFWARSMESIRALEVAR